MLRIQPVSEENCSDEVKIIFDSIKESLPINSVPSIFKYLASFPNYLSYVWEQILNNLSDNNIKEYIDTIQDFAFTAMDQIYKPSSPTITFLEGINKSQEQDALLNFSRITSQTNAGLYLFSLAIRESLKGKYLGLKQIESTPTSKEDVFKKISEDFIAYTGIKKETMSDLKLIQKDTTQNKIITTSYNEYFKLMDQDMKNLMKTESYLSRRVELEKLTLSFLNLLPHPFSTSFHTLVKDYVDRKDFPELIYLISDLFPTESPYKLLSSVVMEKSLTFSIKSSTELKNNSIVTT